VFEGIVPGTYKLSPSLRLPSAEKPGEWVELPFTDVVFDWADR
jgi:hypothetical protein